MTSQWKSTKFANLAPGQIFRFKNVWGKGYAQATFVKVEGGTVTYRMRETHQVEMCHANEFAEIGGIQTLQDDVTFLMLKGLDTIRTWNGGRGAFINRNTQAALLKRGLVDQTAIGSAVINASGLETLKANGCQI